MEAEYKGRVEVMIYVAQQVAVEVRKQVKNALFGPHAEIKGDLSFIDGRFWSETEPAFYAMLRRTRDALHNSADVGPLLQEWYTTLTRAAHRIFDDASQTGDFNATDPRRIALAWNALNKALANKKLRQVLELAA
jgi:CRISPR system Cascade subunit CasA